PRRRAEGVPLRSVAGALAGALHQVERALLGWWCDRGVVLRTTSCIARRVGDGTTRVNTVGLVASISSLHGQPPPRTTPRSSHEPDHDRRRSARLWPCRPRPLP